MWRYYEESDLLQLRKKHLHRLFFKSLDANVLYFTLELIDLLDV